MYLVALKVLNDCQYNFIKFIVYDFLVLIIFNKTLQFVTFFLNRLSFGFCLFGLEHGNKGNLM